MLQNNYTSASTGGLKNQKWHFKQQEISLYNCLCLENKNTFSWSFSHQTEEKVRNWTKLSLSASLWNKLQNSPILSSCHVFFCQAFKNAVLFCRKWLDGKHHLKSHRQIDSDAPHSIAARLPKKNERQITNAISLII